jgi:hypothetical protein
MYVTGGRNELLAATSTMYAPNFNGSVWNRPFSFDDGLWILSGDSVATLAWQNLLSLPRPAGFLSATMAAAVILNGSLYLTGGVVGSGSAAELYFTVTPNTWTLDLNNITAGFSLLSSCTSLTNQVLGLACASAVTAQYTRNLKIQMYTPTVPPSILIFGGITLNSQQQILLLGDLVVYSPGVTPEVSVLQDSAQPPPHKDGAMAAVNFNNQGPAGQDNVSALMDYALYAFGGQSFVGALNNLQDLYRVGLRNGSLHWSRVALNTSSTPDGRSRHTFTAMQSTLPQAPPHYA